MSLMNMEGPEREYGICFTLASLQTLQSQPGLGIVVDPPDPRIISSITSQFVSTPS